MQSRNQDFHAFWTVTAHRVGDNRKANINAYKKQMYAFILRKHAHIIRLVVIDWFGSWWSIAMQSRRAYWTKLRWDHCQTLQSNNKIVEFKYCCRRHEIWDCSGTNQNGCTLMFLWNWASHFEQQSISKSWFKSSATASTQSKIIGSE